MGSTARVIVAGGGPAAVEALLAVRAQADRIAELVVAELTGAAPPEPSAPVLQAVLYGGTQTRYLRARLGDDRDASSVVSSSPLWPGSSKVVGRYLSSYLDSLDARRPA